MINTLRYLMMTTAMSLLFTAAPSAGSAPPLHEEGRMPELGGAIGWLNSPPLSRESLHGKVVLVDFWTYTCINSLRPLPYVKEWAEKYRDAGLVVIGAHTPEFSFEHDAANVQAAVNDLKIGFPVAIDSNYKIWRAFHNEYWPAQYLIDGEGRVRYHHFGEGDYAEIEQVIQELLKENGATGVDASIGRVAGVGVEAAGDLRNEGSAETYVGYRQAERFASSTRVEEDLPRNYSAPTKLLLNQWGLAGQWNVGSESAESEAASGKVIFRFHSRDLHVVLGPRKDGKPVRFKVRVDGAAPGEDSGSDCAADGSGVVREPRLYQLVRQKGQVKDRTFEIEFLDPGVRVFVFTFG